MLISNLEHLIVDQATVLSVQLLSDVLEERLVEVVQQVLVGSQVALVQISQRVIDRMAIDVPAKAIGNRLKRLPLI